MTDGSSVVTLRRGLSVLDAFSSGRGEVGVNELARLVDLDKSTVSRLCSTLERAGYLERLPNRRFRLGARVYELAGVAPNVDLREAAHPVLQRLSEECGETAHVAALVGDDVITMDVVSGPRVIRAHAQVGQRIHLHASAMGKAILAWLPEARQRQLLAGRALNPLTADTITDRSKLRDALRQVREQGYSVDMEELEEGMRCVGAPIRDRTGRVVAAISVTGPRHRFTSQSLPEIGRIVRCHADEVSARLGAPAEPDAVPSPAPAARPRHRLSTGSSSLHPPAAIAR